MYRLKWDISLRPRGNINSWVAPNASNAWFEILVSIDQINSIFATLLSIIWHLIIILAKGAVDLSQYQIYYTRHLTPCLHCYTHLRYSAWNTSTKYVTILINVFVKNISTSNHNVRKLPHQGLKPAKPLSWLLGRLAVFGTALKHWILLAISYNFFNNIIQLRVCMIK